MTTTTTPHARTRSHPLVASPIAATYWITGQALGILNFTVMVGGLALTLTATSGTASNLWLLHLMVAVVVLIWLQRRAFAAAAIRTPGALAGLTPCDLQDGGAMDPAVAQIARLGIHVLRVAALIAAAHWLIGLPLLDRPISGTGENITAEVIIAAAFIGIGLLILAQTIIDLVRNLWRPRTEYRTVAATNAATGAAGGLALTLLGHHALDPALRENVWSLVLTFALTAAIIRACIRITGWAQGGGLMSSRLELPPRMNAAMDQMADQAVTWWKGAATLDDRDRYRPLIKTAGILALVSITGALFTLPKIALVLVLVGGGFTWAYTVWTRHTEAPDSVR